MSHEIGHPLVPRETELSLRDSSNYRTMRLVVMRTRTSRYGEVALMFTDVANRRLKGTRLRVGRVELLNERGLSRPWEDVLRDACRLVLADPRSD